MRVGEAEGDPEGDGRRTLANGWESRLWRLENKHLREGSSVRQFGRPRPLRIGHRRRIVYSLKMKKGVYIYSTVAYKLMREIIVYGKTQVYKLVKNSFVQQYTIVYKPVKKIVAYSNIQ